MLFETTDLSALARNPVFTNNTFFFDPPSNHMLRGSVVVLRAHYAVRGQHRLGGGGAHALEERAEDEGQDIGGMHA